MNYKFHNDLKVMSIRKGLTFKKIAERAGVNPATITRISKGSIPSGDLMLVLAEVLECEVKEIFWIEKINPGQ